MIFRFTSNSDVIILPSSYDFLILDFTSTLCILWIFCLLLKFISRWYFSFTEKPDVMATHRIKDHMHQPSAQITWILRMHLTPILSIDIPSTPLSLACHPITLMTPVKRSHRNCPRPPQHPLSGHVWKRVSINSSAPADLVNPLRPIRLISNPCHFSAAV